MNAMMKKIITEKVQWLREHGVLCYMGDLDKATPAEIDQLCEAIENMTAQVLAAEGEGSPWEADDECCDDDNARECYDEASALEETIREILREIIDGFSDIGARDTALKAMTEVIKEYID